MACPFCSESILVSAKKCRHCNEWLERAQGRAGTFHSGSADARATTKGLKKYALEREVLRSVLGTVAACSIAAYAWVQMNWGEESGRYALFGLVVLNAMLAFFMLRWYYGE